MNSKLEEISGFLQQRKLLSLRDLEKNLHEISQRFHLKLIGSGISRFVFKERYSRKVLKVTTENRHNLAEYCLYQALEGTSLQSLFAASDSISEDGTVLEQEYLSKSLPVRYEDYHFRANDRWLELLGEVESTLSFIKFYTKEKYPTFDLHTDNIKLDSKFNAKIIDYATILSPFIEARNLEKRACIRALSRYTRKHDQRVEFFLDQEKNLVFKTQFNTNKLTLEN